MKKITELLKYIKNTDEDYLKIISPSYMSKKLSTYMLIREDLLFVKKNAELLLFIKTEKKKNEHFEETLWYSLISLYGRCFTDSSHSKKPKLETNDLFSSSNGELITHQNLMDIRHTFIAHRGDNDNELPIVYLKIPKNESIKENNTPFQIISTRYTTESQDFLKEIISLAEFIILKVNEKIQKQSDKLLKGILNLDKSILEQITIK